MWDDADEAQRFGEAWPLWFGTPAMRNRRAAVETVEPLADLGYPPARHTLALAYGHGEGAAKDVNRAFALALPAAEAGYPGSQLIVGNYHLAGGPDGLEVDPREAARWHRSAAARGNSGAQYNLAFSFATGRGVSENPVEACFWAAAAVGCSPIRSRPAEALQAQELEKLTETEREEVDARVSDFLSRWPQPWSEHLVYWKHLARRAGLDPEAR